MLSLSFDFSWQGVIATVLIVVAAYTWGGWQRGWWNEWRRKP
jgi:hypothetical protein